MKRHSASIVVGLMCLAGIILLAGACAPSKPEPVKTVAIADGDFDPANWGKAYPLEYESWQKTKDPKPAGMSKYKKGFDTDNQYDKLSEFPYMPLLFNGWGFGVEYNEPRGHHYMLIDQLEVDPSRLKAGGACLTCKTPYAPKLQEEIGANYLKTLMSTCTPRSPQFQIGVACADCHDNKTLNPKLSRWTLNKALADMGKDPRRPAARNCAAWSAPSAMCPISSPRTRR